MKRRKKYTVSDKVLSQRNKMTDWETRIKVLFLRERDRKTFNEISQLIGLTRQRVEKIYHSVEGKTVQELEEMQRKYEA